MAELRLDRIAETTGGTILQGPPERVFRDFNIDSRRTTPGELFFAIVARRDGHDFVAAAAERGAAGAVVSRPVPAVAGDFALLQVPDSLGALQLLAKKVLEGRSLKVVGITGSVGKTTTKEFTAAILSRKFQVLKSEGNFNNHLGLALTLLRLEPRHDAAVLEMGMSAPGEIRTLTEIAPPDVAVITNVSPVHLEFLKTMEAIAAAKKEILEGMRPDGIAVLNGDDPFVEQIAQARNGRKIFFGLSRGCDIRVENLQRLGYDGFKFDLVLDGDRRRIRFPFLSETYIYDLLAAVGVGRALSLSLDEIEQGIQDLKPYAKRGLLLRLAKKIVVVDDSYNSNPRALEAALRNYAALPARRRVAVLGDMLELGQAAAKFHEDAGLQAERSGWDLLVTVGPLSRRMAKGARLAGMGMDRILSFATSEDAAAQVPALLREGDLVLVKGSRGIRTETIVEALKETFKET
ncbi:MAG: UDP-N-acetylmuramoyl-tripeptide--D-alanyl-D-alanine ligase [Candidatus Aminicenantes bacterium]|jgi:UDP-N-acetylmuramoyl-tripeptide--D-alanyl-D-alanine ligase|nr:UDP-N-acetylmuramoyl-tripeptide--D-alanyl-D-alanine ligase [Candidatus Aminicenantes bacterium]